MNKLYCRFYQQIMRMGMPLMPWRKPELLEGEGSLSKLPALIRSKGIQNVLVVTDKVIASLGLMDPLLLSMEKEGVRYKVYDKTIPNPTIDNIEEALLLYQANQCEGIIAFGGGSAMDCAKGIGARVARPNKTIPQLKGMIKVRKALPPLFAIPTTAGTGSETTIAAVITNSLTHEKYAVNDFSLIPQYAVLDPSVTIGLPPHITSTTGMDALTHAVEAYIGRSNTKETRKMAIDATKLIFENVYTAYSDGSNIQARKNMQMAAYYAGVAFTRAYVGYVHAVAHTLGGFYGVPHGLANAVILPYVLEEFGESVYKPLSELADAVGITKDTDTMEQKAKKFIEAVKALNKKMEIPDKVRGIQDKDIPTMVERADKEANPLYPVPRLMDKGELAGIYQLIMA